MGEIPCEIPNVAGEALVDLGERWSVRFGAHVKSGASRGGKITPKGETELSPEETLLTAIFVVKGKGVQESLHTFPTRSSSYPLKPLDKSFLALVIEEYGYISQ